MTIEDDTETVEDGAKILGIPFTIFIVLLGIALFSASGFLIYTAAQEQSATKVTVEQTEVNGEEVTTVTVKKYEPDVNKVVINAGGQTATIYNEGGSASFKLPRNKEVRVRATAFSSDLVSVYSDEVVYDQEVILDCTISPNQSKTTC